MQKAAKKLFNMRYLNCLSSFDICIVIKLKLYYIMVMHIYS